MPDRHSSIIDGQPEITITGETGVVGSGSAAAILSDNPRSVKALTDSGVIVVDHSARYSIGGIEL